MPIAFISDQVFFHGHLRTGVLISLLQNYYIEKTSLLNQLFYCLNILTFFIITIIIIY